MDDADVEAMKFNCTSILALDAIFVKITIHVFVIISIIVLLASYALIFHPINFDIIPFILYYSILAS